MTTIQPHGGTLINRVLEGAAREEARNIARNTARITLSDVALSDLELISNGGYSPLNGFMGRADYDRVVNEMRLANGTLWPIPIVLPVTEGEADALKEGEPVALHAADGSLVGLLELRERFHADVEREAQQVYRTTDPAHPGVARRYNEGPVLLGGDVWLIEPVISAFPSLDYTPAATRQAFEERGWRTVVAFQTRNPVHRAHEYLQKCALETVDGLLLHPLVGATKSDDVPADIRMRSYQVLLENYYPRDRVLLGVNPAAMRYGGPREAVFHALIRKNFGCTHFIVGRDHAGVGGYYGPYDSQHIFSEFEPGELGIQPLFFENSFFCRTCGNMGTDKTCPHGPESRVTLSGTQVRAMLRAGELPPPEFSRPEVASVLAEAMQEG